VAAKGLGPAAVARCEPVQPHAIAAWLRQVPNRTVARRGDRLLVAERVAAGRADLFRSAAPTASPILPRAQAQLRQAARQRRWVPALAPSRAQRRSQGRTGISLHFRDRNADKS